MPSAAVIEAIAVTAELLGRTFSPAAAMVFAGDLDGYPEAGVLAALTRCRKEVRGMLTVQEVVSRIDDGRPGAEEAWAALPVGEECSSVMTAEMAHAWGVALPLLQSGDKIGARMAFKETYVQAVAAARDRKQPPRWTPSLGTDLAGQRDAMIEAVRKGRIDAMDAAGLLRPELAEQLLVTIKATKHPLLALPPPTKENRERLRAALLTLEMRKPP